MKTKLTLAVLFLFAFLGCKKVELPDFKINNSTNPKNNKYEAKVFATEEQRLAYAKGRLGIIAKALAGLSSSTTFKNILATTLN